MEEKKLKKDIRQVLLGYRMLRKIGKNKQAIKFWGMDKLNEWTIYLHNKARKIDPLLPYYIATKRITLK